MYGIVYCFSFKPVSYTYYLILPTAFLSRLKKSLFLCILMKKFGLIGYPLSHSFSKKYFSEKFDREGILDCEYELYPIQNIEELPLLHKKIGDDLVGLNCTIPYKQTVIPYLDLLSEEANAIQAVNTIWFRGGKKYGYNTDIPGFESTLKDFVPGKVKNSLVLGTGGASKAVLFVLKKLGIQSTLVSRKASDRILSYNDLSDDLILSHPLIVNTTPLGMYPHPETAPEINYKMINSSHYLYDLVYNPGKTLFLQNGEAQGAHIMNGLPMLIGQAEAAWKIWNQ